MLTVLSTPPKFSFRALPTPFRTQLRSLGGTEHVQHLMATATEKDWKLLGGSKKQLTAIKKRLNDLTAAKRPNIPALFGYRGPLLDNLEEGLDEGEERLVNEHMRLVSPFYGVIRPFDCIMDHPCEHMTWSQPFPQTALAEATFGAAAASSNVELMMVEAEMVPNFASVLALVESKEELKWLQGLNWPNGADIIDVDLSKVRDAGQRAALRANLALYAARNDAKSAKHLLDFTGSPRPVGEEDPQDSLSFAVEAVEKVCDARLVMFEPSRVKKGVTVARLAAESGKSMRQVERKDMGGKKKYLRAEAKREQAHLDKQRKNKARGDDV